VTQKLHYTDSGGSGEPVVLVHPIGTDHHMWEALGTSLAPRFRVVRVDVRGHGKSPVPARPYTLGGLADDVLGVLDRLQIGRAHWIGLSIGGMIGQAFALTRGDRLGKLVIANSTSSYGTEGPRMWEARAKAVEEGGLASIKDMVMGRYFSEAFRAQQPEAVAAVSERFMATPVEGYLGCCDAIARLDFAAALPRIKAPTLVIAGELDVGTPVAMSEAIASRIPGARLAVIPGASHISAVEKPLEFERLVKDFFKQ
jgi:3-oxoadipate enol-lactonase